MSRRGKKVDLKLNLAPPAERGGASRRLGREESPSGSSSSPSSCVSSVAESPEAEAEAASMVLAACPRCLMYVMLCEDDAKCPKCKSAVLLDFLHGGGATSSAAKKTRNT